MGKSVVSSIGKEDLPELNTEAGNILRSDIINSVYDAGLKDYWACFKTFKLISPFNNAEVATVEEQFSCCFPAFTINSIYGHYEIDGSIGAHSFTLTKNGMIVATVDKKFFAFSDTYGVEIVETEDPAFILALVIVLDQTCHDE
uniref:Uncharacterized protein n=1 Tax=Panagrolaimus davidi TaxID=227884 RepID=A0A914PLA5_9BILA